MKPKKIKLYSTTTCPYCMMESTWLDSHNIKYTEVKVDLDTSEAQEMVERTGQMGVPVTQIEYEEGKQEFVIGFNQPLLTQLLGIKN